MSRSAAVAVVVLAAVVLAPLVLLRWAWAVGRARQYVMALAVGGRRAFTSEEAVEAMGGSVASVLSAMRRLKANGDIAEPHRGFYVILPPEHRRRGCLPPDGFVPQLMAKLREPHYVALLSAAELHGAVRGRPEAFQVMVKTNRRPIVCGEVRVEFITRKQLERTPVVEKTCAHGTMRVASRAATALELVGYADHCGGFENVGSVVGELAESVDLDELVTAAASCPTAWVQRLGYLLDLTGHQEVADTLVVQVRARRRGSSPLVRGRPTAGAPRVARWRLAVNALIEPEP